MLSPEETALAKHDFYDIARELLDCQDQGKPLSRSDFRRLKALIPRSAPEEVWEAFYSLVRACPEAPMLTRVVFSEDEPEPIQTVRCPQCGVWLHVLSAA
jgi:hypothetical protein